MFRVSYEIFLTPRCCFQGFLRNISYSPLLFSGCPPKYFLLPVVVFRVSYEIFLTPCCCVQGFLRIFQTPHCCILIQVFLQDMSDSPLLCSGFPTKYLWLSVVVFRVSYEIFLNLHCCVQGFLQNIHDFPFLDLGFLQNIFDSPMLCSGKRFPKKYYWLTSVVFSASYKIFRLSTVYLRYYIFNPFSTKRYYSTEFFRFFCWTLRACHTVNNSPIILKSSLLDSASSQLSGEKNRTNLSSL